MIDLRLARAGAVILATGALPGCAVFGGGGGGDEPARPDPVAVEPVDPSAEADDPTETSAPLAGLMLAGDYEGVLAAYAADSTLHRDEAATWRAGLAAATSGHPAHDLGRAQALFQRLLTEHPDSDHRLEAELLVQLIGRERELRSTIGRLDRELSQLKAIDLGQQPADEP